LNSAAEWLSIAGQTKLVVSGGFDLGDKITEQDFHDWYNKEVSSKRGCKKCESSVLTYHQAFCEPSKSSRLLTLNPLSVVGASI
jgi:hypothetical protein